MDHHKKMEQYHFKTARREMQEWLLYREGLLVGKGKRFSEEYTKNEEWARKAANIFMPADLLRVEVEIIADFHGLSMKESWHRFRRQACFPNDENNPPRERTKIQMMWIEGRLSLHDELWNRKHDRNRIRSYFGTARWGHPSRWTDAMSECMDYFDTIFRLDGTGRSARQEKARKLKFACVARMQRSMN